MIYLYGDLWRFCTAAIESRGARLKRMGRTVICWRPYQEGKSVYHYVDHRTGQEVTREQSNKSSPMEQMLSKMLAQERAWHSDSVFVRPAKLRLQQELRRRRLKCEFEHMRSVRTTRHGSHGSGTVRQGQGRRYRRNVYAWYSVHSECTSCPGALGMSFVV